MPLEVIRGESRNRLVAQKLVTQVEACVEEGTLYLGYPILATADERVEIDALLASQSHGLVAFLLADSTPNCNDKWQEVIGEQDRLFNVLDSYLSRHQGLRIGRKLAVTPATATVFPAPPTSERLENSDGFYGTFDEIGSWIKSLRSIDSSVQFSLQAALQRVATIKPAKKRISVTQNNSRGAILKKIEREIANLDHWQKAAAIESPEGHQRIRGLAGSGKTIVLALKAAYWHSQHPDWQIAVTFHSRSLYQQMEDLITRFAFEHTNDTPDYDQLKIMHSWGSRNRPGVYSTIADILGATPRDWSYARGKYGTDKAFAGICRELLPIAQVRQVEPVFDAVLIDEAQDLPSEFFQLISLFTKHPKRIVWAYDELQRLSESAMPTTKELFGTVSGDMGSINLNNSGDEPRRDITLPVCYRNTPWALATAHAIGIGVYREEGLLQHPDNPELWRDVGYSKVDGDLIQGSNVTLERSDSSYPQYLSELLDPNDAVIVKCFEEQAQQDAWVADEIRKNLADEELEHDDILIVLPDPYQARSRAMSLGQHLRCHDIDFHLVGVNTSVDEVFKKDSVVITHIFRAKGNEAPMVYAIDSQQAAGGSNAVTRRNSLFTAITRSRAWVRVVGWGDRMRLIEKEIATIHRSGFRLKFTIPTADELAELRNLRYDRSDEIEASLQQATQGLSAFFEAYERGELSLDDLPPAIRTKLVQSVQRAYRDAYR